MYPCGNTGKKVFEQIQTDQIEHQNILRKLNDIILGFKYQTFKHFVKVQLEMK